MDDDALKLIYLNHLKVLQEHLRLMGEAGARLRRVHHDPSAGSDPWRTEVFNLALATSAAITDITPVIGALVEHATSDR